MKVAVTDYTFDSLDVERAILSPIGCEVVGPYAKGEPDSLLTLVADADCVITQFAPIDARVIGSMGRARAIVRYGIGVDNVDLDAARARGIPVCNVPDYCIDEVADHTLGLILALTRQLIAHRDRVRGGNWGSGAPLHALHSLKALTVGIIGFGRIGRAVADRLRPFRCMTIVADPMVPQGEIEQTGCMPVTFDQMLRTADVITLHCPSLPATRGMIDADALRRMKPGVLFINVARGDLVVTNALIEALQSGRVGGAGLDVCDP
jgi:D-3-phosphoglycerate dehydrogenase / 2-oxoglutarate reductase